VGTTDVNKLGLVELSNRAHNKELLDLVSELTKDLPVLQDAPFFEANGETFHKHTKFITVPVASGRGMYEGVTPTGAQTKPNIEHLAWIEDHVNIDEQEIRLAPNPQQFRFDEDMAHMEGMRQKFGTMFLYGNHATTLTDVNGLATRYNALADANVWDNGGAGSDVTSLWFIKWGKTGVFCVYPRNSKTMGIERNDMGKQLITPELGKQYFAFVTQFIFNFGLVVRDDRCVQRIANIETSISGGVNLIDVDLMIQAKNKMPSLDGVVAYCNDTVLSQLEIAAKDKPNVIWPTTDAFGKRVLTFFGIPIRKFDSITLEDAVA
jgi:hypothetical protein